MQTHFSCSYIIPYIHSPRNLKSLRSTIDTIIRDPRIQVIVVETGPIPILKNIDLKGDYLFVESHNMWNVGWLFNCGSKLTKTDNLFFGSFEYVPRLEVIYNILKDVDENRHCVYSQDSIIPLTKEQMAKKQLDFSYPDLKIPYEGVIYYTRKGFQIVGGWDENVFGQDLYKIQDKRNKSMINVGVLNGSKTFKLNVDLPNLKAELIDYSTKHLQKILGQDKDIVRNYAIAQMKKNGNYHRLIEKNLMDI
tara:strand:- start:20590 stop:21339 length:750 start_codon:yes stop_codon:yes gene_type:complete